MSGKTETERDSDQEKSRETKKLAETDNGDRARQRNCLRWKTRKITEQKDLIRTM